MSRRFWRSGVLALLFAVLVAVPQAGQRPGGGGGPEPAPTPLATPVAKPDARVMKLKEAAGADVLSMYDLGQQMIDMVFSFGMLPVMSPLAKSRPGSSPRSAHG